MSGVVLGVCLLVFYSPQVEAPSGHPQKRSGGQLHSFQHADAHEACKFAPVYQRIKANKSDPRVAFVETRALVQPDGPPSFSEQCKAVSDQVDDVWGIFDKAHGYLQFFSSAGDGPDFDEGIAYFAGRSPNGGVFLYARNVEEESTIRVLAYRDGQWRDVTSQYLANLKLEPTDHVKLPRYGTTADVSTYVSPSGELRHKIWLAWNGEKFELRKTKDGAR